MIQRPLMILVATLFPAFWRSRRPEAKVEGSLICNGCSVYGTALHSILAPDVHISAGAVVRDCILLPGSRVEAGAQLIRTIVNEGVTVPENTVSGTEEGPITLIGE